MAMKPSVMLSESSSVDVGPGPHAHIAYAGSTDRVWVLNSGATSVTLLDGRTGQPDTTIDVGGTPVHVIVDEDTDRAYLLLSEDAVSVVNLGTGSIDRRIPLVPGSGPTAFVPLLGDNRLHVLNGSAGTVDTIDTGTLRVIRTVDVGQRPSWGQPHKKSCGKIHVANAGSDTVSVIDELSGAVVNTVPTGREPTRNAIFREIDQMYTVNSGDDTLTGISLTDDSVTSTVKVGSDPFRLVPMQKKTGRQEIWVLCRGGARVGSGGAVEIVNTQDGAVVASLPLVDSPANWLFEGPIGHIVAGRDRQMAILDSRSSSVVGEAELSHDPDPTSLSNMVVAGSGNLFLVNEDDTVTVFGPRE